MPISGCAKTPKLGQFRFGITTLGNLTFFFNLCKKDFTIGEIPIRWERRRGNSDILKETLRQKGYGSLGFWRPLNIEGDIRSNSGFNCIIHQVKGLRRIILNYLLSSFYTSKRKSLD